MEKEILCFDIGGSSLKCAVCNRNGDIKEKKSYSMCDHLEALCMYMKDYKIEVEKRYCIGGVAISSCGAVDSEAGVIFGTSAVPFIHGPSWKDLINQYLGLPCEIENDANCAALSELYFGKARDVNDMCFIVIGTGVGGAIIKNREIHHGKHLYGGEFGMMLARTSEQSITHTSLLASTSSMVRKIKQIYIGDWDGVKIFEEAEKGDLNCIDIIDTFYKEVAFLVFNIQHILDPEVILFGGAISARDDFSKNVMDAYHTLCKEVDFDVLTPTLMSCTYKQDANILGALAHYLSRHTKDCTM